MDRNSWDAIKRKTDFSTGYWRSYLIIIFDLALLVLSWKLSFGGVLAALLSFLLLVLVLLHFYVLLHEATHGALSKNSKLNNFLGHVFGVFILLPFLPRQTSHLLHHTWTGHPVRDPANNRVIEKFSVITEKQIRQLEFIWKYWLPLLILNDRIGLWKAPFQQKANGLKSAKVKNEIQSIYIYGLILFTLICFLLSKNLFGHFMLWYVPSFVAALVLEELINLPHHAETPLLSAEDKALPYWDQHKVTHSCEAVPLWSKYLLLNFNFHTAHHLYPNAPWYQLPSLNEEILKVSPSIITEHKTTNELEWSVLNRKRPLLTIMGHYFNKLDKTST